ncbi:hypothetical protein [Falsiroseomonas sp. CW058]|uniref:hypothetical protein n=1 Tax=Falsiroseomonas sp. CW058 TaxID=3388664 RepID=UPI003D320135
MVAGVVAAAGVLVRLGGDPERTRSQEPIEEIFGNHIRPSPHDDAALRNAAIHHLNLASKLSQGRLAFPRRGAGVILS